MPNRNVVHTNFCLAKFCVSVIVCLLPALVSPKNIQQGNILWGQRDLAMRFVRGLALVMICASHMTQ